MEKTELITTACGFLGLPPKRNQLKSLWNDSNLFVDPEMIWCAAQELHKRSKVYKETGGTHSAILCSEYCEVYAYAPDVGRHNAVDKVVGEGISKNIDLRSCVLVSSGRLSGEIVLKAARSGIPIIASVSGPLESGIRIAEETGVTLIGFIRGRRMNLYTHNKRISFE
jgi:FdhD protein